jgi:septum formation protein
MTIETKKTNARLLLLSTSPRRKELLEQLGLPIEVMRPQGDERSFDSEFRSNRLKEVVLGKMSSVNLVHHHHSTYLYALSADTVVVSGSNKVLGKPKDLGEAKEFLMDMAQETFSVYTGVAIKRIHQGESVDFYAEVQSRLSFNNGIKTQIDFYLNQENWQDKAGGFSFQGLGQLWVKQVEGSLSNIKGLPLETIYEYFENEFGFDWISEFR